MKKILIILGHPDSYSFCSSLTNSYFQGAKETGYEIKRLNIGDLNFDPNLKKGYKEIQKLEPDLVQAQKDISWADHIVWVYPNWWASMPAIMKGFIDRTILPGFAFKYKKDSWKWDKLLKGKSAHLIVTLDTPSIFNHLYFGSPTYKIMKKGVLGFCGVKPIRITAIAPVRYFTEDKRKMWLEKINLMGKNGK